MASHFFYFLSTAKEIQMLLNMVAHGIQEWRQQLPIIHFPIKSIPIHILPPLVIA